MARLRLTIRGDGLAAELHASPGPPATAAEVQAVLAEAKVVHGLDQAALDQFTARLADAQFTGKVEIAKGTAPVAGTDGRLEGACLMPQLPGTEHTDGHIDYHERVLLHPAALDQDLARITAPTPGTAGCNVRGLPLPAKPGKPHQERLGPGVRCFGDRLVAARNGTVLHTERSFDVVPLHVHQGDVDLDSGNLHTHGSLQVQGDVHEGFAATADGHVHVTGAVFSGTVTAGASVRVDQGVLGTGSELRAGDDLVCRHATSASLQAGRLVEIGDQATHCRIQATHIRAARGRGAVFGGSLRSRQSIEVRAAGTATGAPTLLSVADLLDAQTELVRLQAEAARFDRANLRSQRGEDGRLGGGKALRLATRAGDRSQQERLRLLALQRELLSAARITILDTAHPGVVLQFGAVRLPITLPIQGGEFRFDLDHDKIVQKRLP